MRQCLLSVYQPDGALPPKPELEKIMANVKALRDEAKAAGAWVFSAGLHPPSTATVVKAQDGDLLITDGPYTEGKEHIGGFSIIQAPDLDAAEEAAQDAFTVAVQRWPSTGLPPSPVGWIITTARHRAIDKLRREASRDDRHAEAVRLHGGDEPVQHPAADDEGDDCVRDDRLNAISFAIAVSRSAAPNRVILDRILERSHAAMSTWVLPGSCPPTSGRRTSAFGRTTFRRGSVSSDCD